MATFKIKKGNNNQFYFHLTASGNHEIILNSSEGYITKQGCNTGISSVRLNAPWDSRYNKSTASNGQYYFTLHAPNGEKIGMSEMYNSALGRDHGIQSVQSNAPNAGLEDLT